MKKMIMLFCSIVLGATLLICVDYSKRKNKPTETQSNQTIQSETQNNQTIQYSNIANVESLTYDNNHIKTKISLTDYGEEIVSTNPDLLKQKCKVIISLNKNSSDKPYITFEEMEWNFEDLDIDIVLDRNKINSNMLEDFNNQLKKAENNENHTITYRIQFWYDNTLEHSLRVIGVLDIVEK